MATLAVFVHVGYKDQPGRVSERVYRLNVLAEDDGSNMDTVLAAVDDLETALDVLTMDHIEYIDTRLHKLGAGAAANVAANNINRAFVRTVITSTSRLSSFEVPAWDDPVFNQEKSGRLSAAYQAACDDVAALTVDPDTGLAWTVQYAQARDSKAWKKID